MPNVANVAAPSHLNGASAPFALASHLNTGAVERPHTHPDCLFLELVDKARFGQPERSVFGNTESNYARMDQPCKSALPDESLETVVGFPVALPRPVKELQFERQAVPRRTNNKVKTMDTVQPNGCP